MVNINMGVFDCISKGMITMEAESKENHGAGGPSNAHVVTAAYTLLKDLVYIFNKMDSTKQVSQESAKDTNHEIVVLDECDQARTIIRSLTGSQRHHIIQYCDERALRRSNQWAIGLYPQRYSL